MPLGIGIVKAVVKEGGTWARVIMAEKSWARSEDNCIMGANIKCSDERESGPEALPFASVLIRGIISSADISGGLGEGGC